MPKKQKGNWLVDYGRFALLELALHSTIIAKAANTLLWPKLESVFIVKAVVETLKQVLINLIFTKDLPAVHTPDNTFQVLESDEHK